MLKMKTLMDNAPSENKSLINKHGLSVLVENGKNRFLFDCGADGDTWRNAHRLGVDIKNVDGVILSHSHYDHAAGYRDLLEMGAGGTLLYTGNHFFEPKYAFDGIKYTDLSAGFTGDFLKEHGVEHRICGELTGIGAGLWLIGNFDRVHSFETTADRFVKEGPEGMQRDLFEDEICMVMETEKGLVLLVGCSHPGILNIAETVYKRLGKPIYAVFGGTHLVEAAEERIRFTVETLKKMGVTILGLSHCSGALAERMVDKDSEIKGCHMAVGDCIII